MQLINKLFNSLASTPGSNPLYHRQVALSNRQVEVIIKRSRRKSLALHVFPDKPVELRAPLKCPWVEIDRFLASRTQWIEDAQNELLKIPRQAPPEYTEGSLHRFRGTHYPLRLDYGRPSGTRLFNNMILVKCSRPGRKSLVATHLDRWYVSEAKLYFSERLTACLQRFPVPMQYNRLIIRKMKARWGSCSNTRDICLNSLLIRMPDEAIDFVITHELCHLQHFSHSKAFYKLLASAMPDWQEREALLLVNE